MKTVRFVAYLLYRYYSSHGFAKDLPYLSTICILSLLFFLHLAQLLLVLNLADLIPTDGSQFKIRNYLEMALFMAPILLLFRLLIKKVELKEALYSKEKIKRGYVFLILYIVACFGVMIILALYRKGML